MPDSKTLEILLRIRDLASKELEKFRKGAGTAGKEVTKEMSSLNKQVVNVRNAFLAFVGVPTTIQGIAYAFKFLIKDVMNFAQQVKEGATSMALTTDQFQILRGLSVKFGFDLNTLQMGFFTLATELDRVREGDEKAIAKFEEFGVTFDDVRNKGIGLWEVFGRLVNRLGIMQNEARRTAIAKDLLGKAGARLSEIFVEAGGNFEKMLAIVSKEIPMLSKETLDKIDDARKRWDMFWESVRGIGPAIFAGTLDMFNELANFDITKKSALKFKEMSKQFEKMGAQLTEYQKLLEKTGKLGPETDKWVEYGEAITGIPSKIEEVVKVSRTQAEAQYDIAKAYFVAGGSIQEEINQLKKLQEQYVENTNEWKTVGEEMKKLSRDARAFSADVGLSWTSAMSYATNTAINWEKTFKGVIDNMRAGLSSWAYETILRTGDARKAYQDFFRSILKMITDLMAQKMVAEFFTMFVTAGAGGGGGGGGVGGGGKGFIETPTIGRKAKGGIINRMSGFIPAFQDGGIVSSPSLALVGEGGRNEAVVPLPDNRSIPVKFTEGGGRAVNITFNILANDTRGFDDLLVKRRSLVIGMVSEAMQSNRDFRRSMS